MYLYIKETEGAQEWWTLLYIYSKAKSLLAVIKNWCVLTQITKNKLQYVLAQITLNNFFLCKDKDKNEMCVGTNQNYQSSWSVSTNHKRQFFFFERTRTKTWCMLTQITKNRFQHVLAHIIRDNFFSMKGQGQKKVCVGTNQNKQIQKYASINHKWYWLVIIC